MDITLSKKLGLIAGDGELPVRLAKSAQENGFEIVAISFTSSNRRELSNYCQKIYPYGPGEIQKMLNTLQKEGITQLSFIGKVHKGLLFQNPRLDSKAIEVIKKMRRLNDDAIMLAAIEELSKENITVLDQTIFIKELLAPKGVFGKYMPTNEQKLDIEYGFNIAKEMGKLDIGQSVIIKNKMILAVEAIEGTDRAIRRGCRLGKNDAVVVKVSKPSQDKRFDIPAVGLNTLKTMKKYGGRVLAVEAGETIIVQKEEMIKYADKNKMVFVAV